MKAIELSERIARITEGLDPRVEHEIKLLLRDTIHAVTPEGAKVDRAIYQPERIGWNTAINEMKANAKELGL